MIDDGLGFQLVPWYPVLDKRLGQPLNGVMHDNGGIEWSLGRQRGSVCEPVDTAGRRWAGTHLGVEARKRTFRFAPISANQVTAAVHQKLTLPEDTRHVAFAPPEAITTKS
ncbi:hypothetical protein M2281_003618 [Mesorhizobium soli]|nr:hypothetical protein [Mesorhizobium soli]